MEDFERIAMEQTIADLRFALRQAADRNGLLEVKISQWEASSLALTDAEREAVEQAIDAANGMSQAEPWTIKTLRGLLDRLA